MNAWYRNVKYTIQQQLEREYLIFQSPKSPVRAFTSLDHHSISVGGERSCLYLLTNAMQLICLQKRTAPPFASKYDTNNESQPAAALTNNSQHIN